MNYKEIQKGLPPEEAAKYASGINVVHDMVDSLQRQGLLPKRFAQLAENTADRVERAFYVIPEGVGVRSTLDIGGKPVEQLVAEAKNVRNVSGYALDMIHNPKFDTLEEVTSQELIKLRVRDFGLPGTPTTRQVFERAIHSRVGNKALELCRPEVGLHQAIADTEQPMNSWYYIAHEPITDRYGDPDVFRLGRDSDGLWLGGIWARPGGRWGPEFQLMFALRNIEPVKA